MSIRLDPSAQGIYFDKVDFASADGVQLQAWVVPVIDAKKVLAEKEASRFGGGPGESDFRARRPRGARLGGRSAGTPLRSCQSAYGDVGMIPHRYGPGLPKRAKRRQGAA